MADLMLRGHDGKLEVRYHDSGNPKAPVVVNLHHHPRFGGHMNQPAVKESYCFFKRLGYNVVRYNGRGVGASTGEFTHGPGEILDCNTIMDWADDRWPHSSNRIVVGFSFGAWISAQVFMRRPDLRTWVGVSPPANFYDFTFMDPMTEEAIVIAGVGDAVVPISCVRGMVKDLSRQPGTVACVEVDGANHLFENKTEAFQRTLKNLFQVGEPVENTGLSFSGAFEFRMR